MKGKSSDTGKDRNGENDGNTSFGNAKGDSANANSATRGTGTDGDSGDELRETRHHVTINTMADLQRVIMATGLADSAMQRRVEKAAAQEGKTNAGAANKRDTSEHAAGERETNEYATSGHATGERETDSHATGEHVTPLRARGKAALSDAEAATLTAVDIDAAFAAIVDGADDDDDDPPDYAACVRHRPHPALTACYLNTHGRPVSWALRYGVLRGMPFHRYAGPAFGADATSACNIRAYKEQQDAGDIDPLGTMGSIIIRMTDSTSPYAAEYPLDWSESEYCMFTQILKQGSLLIPAGDANSEPPADAAPDCFVLCEATSGLALPVPLGSVLIWEVAADYCAFDTHHIRKLPVSGAAVEYADPYADVDEGLLAEEAAATERYIAGLIALSEDPNFQPNMRVDDRYARYVAEIAHIRRAHAAFRRHYSA